MSELPEPALPPAPRGLRSLFADSLVYGISVAATPVALVLATPILARELDPEGYGIVDLLASLVAFASIAATAGLDSAAARTWFDESTIERRLGSLRTATALVAASSAAVAAVLAAAGAAVAVAAGSGPGLAAAVAAFALMPLANVQLVARLGFLLPRRRGAYLAAGLLQALFGAGAAVALVVGGAGPYGYFLGLGLGALAALAFSLGRSGILRRGRWIVREHVRPMLGYGLPLVPAAAAAWLVFALDRSLVVGLRDLDEAGLYGLASKVTAPLLLLVSAFGIAWPPFIFGQPRDRRSALRARALGAVLAGAGALFVVVVLFAEELVRALGGPAFAEAERAVPGLALGWVGWAAATVLQSEFALERRTSVIATSTGLAALVNVALNLALIPPYGFVGAAWATAASFLLLALVFAVRERRSARVPYDLPRLAAIAAVVAGGTAGVVLDGAPARALVAVAAVAILGWLAAGHRERPG